jgi:hypothetical protein
MAEQATKDLVARLLGMHFAAIGTINRAAELARAGATARQILDEPAFLRLIKRVDECTAWIEGKTQPGDLVGTDVQGQSLEQALDTFPRVDVATLAAATSSNGKGAVIAHR